MQKWNSSQTFDLVGYSVHRIRADEKHLGSGILKFSAQGPEVLPGLVPSRFPLHTLDRLEIDGVENDWGRSQPTQPFPHSLIDEAVVGKGGIPSHASQQSECSHKLAYREQEQ